MIEIISVRFRGGSKNYFFDPKGLQITPDTYVIVETAQGLAYAKCVEGNHSVEDNSVVLPLREVVRIATDADHKTAEYNRKREKEAFGICEKKIADHKLDMKLVSVECSFEGNKIIFFFTAEGRVDFRELVKDLASVFRARIELRQIGVRDEAKMLGGLGICGRPLCCNQFLEEFIPVSIKMAKTQNLSLNPTKISGTCGRLMCCLKYEQNAYEDAVKRMPKNDSFVDTPDGVGNVSSIDPLREEVQVRLDNSPESPKKYKNCEVNVLRSGKGSREGIEIPKERPARYINPANAEESSSRTFPARSARDTADTTAFRIPENTEEKSGANNRRKSRPAPVNSRRRGESGKTSENKGSENKSKVVVEKATKSERVPKNERKHDTPRPPRPARAERAEVVEKLPVRSNSNTTAEKKAAADRAAARAQGAPQKHAENKKPFHRRPRPRPKSKGGNQGE
ncbi:MAG: stage 0 sporulation family protein [Oscillospiraceae bacterium]|nr:stage 0 sporulation family protein [Oscillospiraceae bacterium]